MNRITQFSRRFRSRDRRLDLEIDDIDAHYRVLIKAARSRGDGNEVARLRSEHQEELAYYYDEREALFTAELMTKARRYRIPGPPSRDETGQTTPYWTQSHRTGSWHLTPEGIRVLRDAIRIEEGWRRDKRVQLVIWITALTGLIGAITGLVSVLMSP
jgi:hypothetical protein